MKKEKKQKIFTHEKASFIRRGMAYLIDLIIIVIISLPLVFGVVLSLSYLFPEHYENPITQIKEAFKSEKSVKQEFTTDKRVVMPIGKPRGTSQGEGVDIVIGEEFGWIHEVVIFYLYFTLSFYFWRGRTIGKRMLGLKVIKRDGSKLTLWNAFERAHGYAASTLLALLGFFQVFWDKEGLTMHDKIAGTNVVRMRKVKVNE